jgi:hypothetical protein
MKRLSRSTHDRIVELIIPLVRTESERSGLLSSAFSDHPALIDRVNLSGSPSAFAAHLLQTLLDYGEIEPGVPAVWRLLERIRERVGGDKQRQQSGSHRPDPARRRADHVLRGGSVTMRLRLFGRRIG